MPAIVVDCSVAVAWCFEDEATVALDMLLDRVQTEGAIVPGSWMVEVANVLTGAVQRGRLSRETMHERLALLDMLPIETDPRGVGPVWRSSVVALADMESLTAYDAVYLELAMRHGLALATCDRALRRAAARRGIIVAPADPA